jgi:hypothetical protein
MTTYFSNTIFIWIDRYHPERGTQRLSSVENAIAALIRADVSEYSSDKAGRVRPVWRAALHDLSRAKANQEPTSSAAAHNAMRQLTQAVGILAAHGGRL